MDYRELGRTGLRVSVLGFGCGNVGGLLVRGTPAEGRQAARSGDVETLWRVYEAHLRKPEAVEAMDELIALVRARSGLCLLCFERDPGHCHRTRIAEIVQERTGTPVENLFASPA